MRMMLRGLLSEALGDMTLEESEEVWEYASLCDSPAVFVVDLLD